jgi:hypothetical protein
MRDKSEDIQGYARHIEFEMFVNRLDAFKSSEELVG